MQQLRYYAKVANQGLNLPGRGNAAHFAPGISKQN